MTQTEKPWSGVAELVGNVGKGILSAFTGGSLRCPRCSAQEQLVGLDVTLAAHLAIYRCSACGHEDRVPEPVFPYEG